MVRRECSEILLICGASFAFLLFYFSSAQFMVFLLRFMTSPLPTYTRMYFSQCKTNKSIIYTSKGDKFTFLGVWGSLESVPTWTIHKAITKSADEKYYSEFIFCQSVIGGCNEIPFAIADKVNLSTVSNKHQRARFLYSSSTKNLSYHQKTDM